MVFSYKSNKENSITIYQLEGELIDRNQATEMLQEFETAITNNENKILLDLEQLKYVNSSGLNVMINILTKTRKAGGEVAIYGVNKKIKELLLITKLNNIFNVCDTKEDAVKIVNK